jgi:DNA-binding SARP family transcriptional activator
VRAKRKDSGKKGWLGMARLAIYLLGPLRVILDGEPVTGFISDKARALLAYLAVESDHSHRRESLAGLLWPDFPEKEAHRSLASALANVRKLIDDSKADPPFLHSTPKEIQFNRASDSWVDVVAFTGLLQDTGCESDSNPIAMLGVEEAVKLYQGEFLRGFSIADSDLFEDWALIERGRLEVLAIGAVSQLIRWYESRGQLVRALSYARRQVELVEAWS